MKVGTAYAYFIRRFDIRVGFNTDDLRFSLDAQLLPFCRSVSVKPDFDSLAVSHTCSCTYCIDHRINLTKKIKKKIICKTLYLI